MGDDMQMRWAFYACARCYRPEGEAAVSIGCRSAEILKVIAQFVRRSDVWVVVVAFLVSLPELDGEASERLVGAVCDVADKPEFAADVVRRRNDLLGLRAESQAEERQDWDEDFHEEESMGVR